LAVAEPFFKDGITAIPCERPKISLRHWTKHGCKHAYRRRLGSLLWWLQLSRQPAHGVRFQGINGQGNLINAVAGRAFKCALLEATFSGRNPGQPEPVLTGRTHRAVEN
jgi:hypothetical protein